MARDGKSPLNLRLEDEIEIADPAQKQGNQDGGNEKAFDHGTAVKLCARADWSPNGRP
jgi:hypothetical protein